MFDCWSLVAELHLLSLTGVKIENRIHTNFTMYIVTDSHHHNTRALTNCFLFFYQLNATVIPDYDDETPVDDNNEPSKQNRQHLTTINYDTLDGLREESQPTEVQSVTKQGGATQEVGEELIGTCVTPTRVKTIQHALSKPETERHLCALKLPVSSSEK